jgi:hypothetical protein
MWGGGEEPCFSVHLSIIDFDLVMCYRIWISGQMETYAYVGAVFLESHVEVLAGEGRARGDGVVSGQVEGFGAAEEDEGDCEG